MCMPSAIRINLFTCFSNSLRHGLQWFAFALHLSHGQTHRTGHPPFTLKSKRAQTQNAILNRTVRNMFTPSLGNSPTLWVKNYWPWKHLPRAPCESNVEFVQQSEFVFSPKLRAQSVNQHCKDRVRGRSVRCQ